MCWLLWFLLPFSSYKVTAEEFHHTENFTYLVSIPNSKYLSKRHSHVLPSNCWNSWFALFQGGNLYINCSLRRPRKSAREDFKSCQQALEKAPGIQRTISQAGCRTELWRFIVLSAFVWSEKRKEDQLKLGSRYWCNNLLIHSQEVTVHNILLSTELFWLRTDCTHPSLYCKSSLCEMVQSWCDLLAFFVIITLKCSTSSGVSTSSYTMRFILQRSAGIILINDHFYKDISV